MITARSAVSVCLTAMTLTGANLALSQEYPIRPIRIITSTPSSSTNVTSRLIAQGITEPLGQAVIVENKSQVAAITAVASAQPDGYTILVAGGTMWTLPLMDTSTNWDPVKDFSPITLAMKSPNLLVVNASLPVKSVSDLIALAKSQPGKLNYAAATPGSSNQLAGELFKSMAGINIVAIYYKDAGRQLADLVDGKVQVSFDNAFSLMPQVKAGKLRALAIASEQPSPLAPGMATMEASGMPGFTSGSVHGVWAPAKTPPAIVRRLNQEIVKYLSEPDVKQRALAAGLEVTVSSPEETLAWMKGDMALWGKVIKDANIHAE